MLPGPDLIYECPKCTKQLSKGSLLSGNTYGAELYSDGKWIYPMMPDFPDLTKCVECGHLFWLSDLEPAKELYHNDMMEDPEQNFITRAPFLEIDDYFEALETSVAKNESATNFIRQQILFAYNDRLREGKDIFINEEDEKRWKGNIHAMIYTLKEVEEPDANVQITLAELYRNLGAFDQCLQFIDKVENDELAWLKDKFKEECEKGNRWVIKLNSN